MAIILWWLYSAVITHYWPSKPTSDTAAHLLGVIGGPGHEGGHVEHDLQPREVCKHTVLSREVSLAVQAAQETLKSLQAHPLPQDIEELIEGSRLVLVGKDLLLGGLALLDTQHPHLVVRLDEGLQGGGGGGEAGLHPEEKGTTGYVVIKK